ncbi:MAG: KTSC domain-containing protein [Cyclobacteriaceae bacterium]
MERHSVDSSMAITVGYETLTSTLEIEFRSGEVWQYHHVPENVYDEMISGSIGKYFQAHIKGQYSESRVT